MSLTVWTLSLELARICGWTPAGTSRHDPAEGKHVDTMQGFRHLMGWQAEYRSSEGQLVSAPDATQLAESLATAAATGERILLDWETSQAKIPGIRTEAKSFSWLTSPEGKEHLRNLVHFCRGGAFEIC